MLNFSAEEYARRRAAFAAAMERAHLDTVLIFAPETQYWLTGFDSFGYCFFQCLIWDGTDGVFLTRSADKRQAELTSTLTDIRVWQDRAGADPAGDLAALLRELGRERGRIGVEWDTHGLTAGNGRRLTAALEGMDLADASALCSPLRLVKSAEELLCVRRAAELCDEALEAGVAATKPGAHEGAVLAAMQGAVFEGGGGYPGNPFIAGAGPHALLCRTVSARREIDVDDQLTLEWAAAYRHYHVAGMQTLVIGTPRPRHIPLFDACRTALLACEDTLRPGRTMGEVFAAHARVFDDLGLSAARLNACGYSLGTRFAPSWMEREMFYDGAETEMAPGMVFFLHMILMESETGTAMCLGRTSLVTDAAAEPLSHHPLEMFQI